MGYTLWFDARCAKDLIVKSWVKTLGGVIEGLPIGINDAVNPLG
jgi:hypothetical protein